MFQYPHLIKRKYFFNAYFNLYFESNCKNINQYCFMINNIPHMYKYSNNGMIL